MLLKYKNEVVASVKMIGNKPVGYETVYNTKLMPIGTILHNAAIPMQERQFFNEWLKSRSVPSVRQNIESIKAKLGISPSEGFIKSLGVSLTDSYWFCPKNSNLTWEDVNFYDNGFESTFAKALSGIEDGYTFQSPDFTTDGVMEKFWYASGNEIYLSKMDRKSNVLLANESVAYQIARTAKINCTPYFSNVFGPYMTIDCPNFGQKDWDYVNAVQIKHNDVARCIGTGLADYFDNTLGLKKELDDIRFLDALLHQEDRHEKNIGILIKNHNLSTAKMVPIFDNGACLGFGRSNQVESSADDLKFFKKSRRQVMFDIKNLPVLSKKNAFEILESVYKEFNIPEENLQYAKEELETGFLLYEEALRAKSMENTLDYEKEL